MYKNRIPQIVPPSWCMSCDVCCHFPEEDSFLAPYFTRDEIDKALKEGLSRELFKNPEGCKIQLVPFGEGFICPAYDPHTSRCRIYPIRPLDCKLYPFALMEDIRGESIILGVDEKCPFIMESREESWIRDRATTLARIIEGELFPILLENRELIGPYQEDVYPLLKLNIPKKNTKA